MSNYSRVEVNLLPPELLPPPSVRIATIVNAFIVVGALMYIGVATYLVLIPMASARDQIGTLELQIAAKQPALDTYNQLMAVKESVDDYGRIISLASVDYIDLPVLMERLARIIPSGVYLTALSNEKPVEGAQNSIVQVSLATAERDPQLIRRTLEAFKHDTIFHDSYMRDATFKQESLEGQLDLYGVDWTASGPDVPESVTADRFTFEILANVSKPIDAGSLPISIDNSVFLADVEFKTPPPPVEDEKGAKRSKAKKAAADAKAENAPEGVEVEEVH
jgi:Tfp pilus assembly protein PilN